MSQDGAQERTEEATPKRRKEAREKGQTARSKDLNTMVVLLVGATACLAMGGIFINSLSAVMRSSFTVVRENIFNDNYIPNILSVALGETLLTLLPFLFALIMAALLGPLLLGGWSFSFKSAAPKLERMSLLKGLKRMFSMRAVVELLKSLIKFIVIAFFSAMLLWSQKSILFSLGEGSVIDSMQQGMELLAWGFIALSAVLIFIVAIDVPYQIWEHVRQLKMTKQEVKDEFKETEGKPEVRGKIRRAQQEISRRRMMEKIPEADVVITNPIHYSIALRYDQQGAPRVIAKGVDIIAIQIQKIALAHDIVIVSAPPLARAIYFSTELNYEVPTGLYLAVAQVLAYVYQIKNYKKGKAKKPKNLPDLPIPDEFRRNQ